MRLGISCIFDRNPNYKDLYKHDCLSSSIIEQYRIDVDIHNSVSVHSARGSSGNQRKCLHGDKFVKLNCLGYEDIAEVCCCWLLKYCQLGHGFVLQYPCNVYNGSIFLGHGVISDDYVHDAEEITFAEILRSRLESFAIEYDDIIDLILDEYGINVGSYLDLKACVDAMVRNEDSHWGNFALLSSEDGIRTAPLFDLGDSCMSDCVSYPIEANFDNCFNQLKAKPFRTNFEAQINPFCRMVLLKYEMFSQSVLTGENKEFDRAIQTIMYGLNKSKGIAWEELR